MKREIQFFMQYLSIKWCGIIRNKKPCFMISENFIILDIQGLKTKKATQKKNLLLEGNQWWNFWPNVIFNQSY